VCSGDVEAAETAAESLVAHVRETIKEAVSRL